jgi:hypothetical protein
MPHVYVSTREPAACCPADRVIGSVSELLELYP